MKSLRENLEDYIQSIEQDIEDMERYEEEVSVLDCCDNREMEVLENVASALRIILNKGRGE